MRKISTQSGGLRAPRRKSLRTVLMLYVLLPMGVAIATGAWWALRVFEGLVEQQMQRDLELVASAIERPLSHALLREREGGVAEALQAAFEISEVYGAYLYDAEGRPLSDTQPHEGAVPLDEATQHAATGEIHGTYGEVGGRDVYSHFVPLTDASGQITGLLQLTRRRSDFINNIHALRLRTAGWFLFAFMGLSLTVVFGHHRAIGRHMDGLTESMSIIARGDRSHRHRPAGSRELVALGAHFNRMLDTMAAAEAEIATRQASERSLEERLAHAEKLAAIGELAAGVAHELGTPLSTVDARAQRALRAENLPAEHAKAFEIIQREAGRMEHIIRQLLDFSRRNQPARRPVACDLLLRDAAAAVTREAEASGTRITLGDPVDLTVDADPVRVEQALVNLLRNAVQACPGGQVHTSVRDTGEEAVFCVEDQGPGIAPEVASKIFEPFFTTKGVGEGTGLGLAVVHGIAGEHGGRVEFERNREQGACFSLYLPKPKPKPNPNPMEGRA